MKIKKQNKRKSQLAGRRGPMRRRQIPQGRRVNLAQAAMPRLRLRQAAMAPGAPPPAEPVPVVPGLRFGVPPLPQHEIELRPGREIQQGFDLQLPPDPRENPELYLIAPKAVEFWAGYGQDARWACSPPDGGAPKGRVTISTHSSPNLIPQGPGAFPICFPLPSNNFTIERFKWDLIDWLRSRNPPWYNPRIDSLGVNQLTLKIQGPTDPNLKIYGPGQGNEVIIMPGSYVEVQHSFPNQR